MPKTVQNLCNRFVASKRKEVWGIRLEIAGLLLALGTALYQAKITDWFPKYQQDAVAYSQESAMIDVLLTLNKLSLTLRTDDAQLRKEAGEDIYQRTHNAVNQIIRDRETRKSVDRGQATSFGNVRLALFAISGLLIILGKYLVMRHKHEALVPPDA